jgi:NitT/TauT family transport system substrate-binding protein
MWSKVALGVTVVFFIVFFNTYQGVREVWAHSHDARELRERLPASLRTEDQESDLETLRYLIDSSSTDGRMPPDRPEGVRRVLAVTSEQVRNAKIDLAATYTNQFVDEAR